MSKHQVDKWEKDNPDWECEVPKMTAEQSEYVKQLLRDLGRIREHTDDLIALGEDRYKLWDYMKSRKGDAE